MRIEKPRHSSILLWRVAKGWCRCRFIPCGRIESQPIGRMCKQVSLCYVAIDGRLECTAASNCSVYWGSFLVDEVQCALWRKTKVLSYGKSDCSLQRHEQRSLEPGQMQQPVIVMQLREATLAHASMAVCKNTSTSTAARVRLVTSLPSFILKEACSQETLATWR